MRCPGRVLATGTAWAGLCFCRLQSETLSQSRAHAARSPAPTSSQDGISGLHYTHSAGGGGRSLDRPLASVAANATSACDACGVTAIGRQGNGRAGEKITTTATSRQPSRGSIPPTCLEAPGPSHRRRGSRQAGSSTRGLHCPGASIVQNNTSAHKRLSDKGMTKPPSLSSQSFTSNSQKHQLNTTPIFVVCSPKLFLSLAHTPHARPLLLPPRIA